MRFRFIGRVQGVSFRQFVRTRSGLLGVGGFVRNRPDGTVEAELEGEPEAIAELERALHMEHPLARIDRVDREEIPVAGSRPPVHVR
ncbi:MAG: acylphosphatase [Thermoplasmata archaeon]